MEITYDQGGELRAHEFKKNLIEKEYVIKIKSDSSRNPQVNSTVDRIHQVIGNLVRTYDPHGIYVDEADPWMGILAASTFAVRSKYHRNQGKIPGQLLFGRDMILPINNTAD